MLQTSENRITLPPELEEEQKDRQFLELLSRMVENAFRDVSDLETDRTAQEAMMSGHLTSCYTPDRIITPDRVVRNTHMKSAWFEHSAHLGLKDPWVLNFSFGRPLDEDAGPEIEGNEEEAAELLKNLGQEPYLWTTSEKLTIFTARPSGPKILPKDITNSAQKSEPEPRFLPKDITTSAQESTSGLVFAPGADPGKIGKRLRCYSGAPGVFFDSRPSFLPELNLGGAFPYRMRIRNSGTVGDGGGSCRSSIAREILQLSCAPLWGDIIAFQIVALGADYSFKALINIVPDEAWTDESADLVIDAKSVNHQVHSTKVTVGKLMPTRHKKNKNHFYVEPMNLGEVVNRFIDPDQLTAQAMAIAERADRENWDRAMDRSEELQAEFQAELRERLEENNEDDWEDLTHIQRAARQQPEEKNGLKLAYEECLGSPFGLPSVANLVTEGLANSWEFQLKRSRKKSDDWNWETGKPESPTLTGIMASGEKLLLMDPGYAGVPYPRKGYVRLIRHPKRDEQLIGIGLAKVDTLRLRDAFDGMDVDGDKLQMIPMRDERGQPQVLLMRSPMSIDGGACLRLTLKDAAELERMGYHFYRKTGEHQHPGLYQIRDGEQAYPDVLQAHPHETTPEWTTDPDLMVRRTMEMNQYRGIMGKVCLAAANLDYAGLYDPAKHKFNMSEAVIDPSLNASADPTPVLLPLQETILKAVREGTPLDRCLFPRIRKGIREMFRERHPGEEFAPVLTCRHHHHQWREGQEAANRFLRDRMKERGLLAHGPAEWLSAGLRTKLYNLAVRALEERTAIWAHKAQEEREIWQTKDLSRHQKEARIAALIRDAKDAENAVVNDAYRKAVKTVEDLEPGQFMAAWIQAAVSRSKRFRRFEPIRTGALLRLPPEEIRGFFRRGESVPTAIIRVNAGTDVPGGTPCYVEEAQVNGRHVHQLVSTEDGETIAELGHEARYYLGLDLETAGYLPKVRITLRKNNTWQQTDPQMVLRVTNPQDA